MPRYDAERTVAVFASRLQEEIEFENIGADVLDVVAKTVDPVTTGLWIRGAGRGAGST